MIVSIADNIITPLGDTTAANIDAILDGRTGLRRHDGLFGLPEPVCASLIDRDDMRRRFGELCDIRGVAPDGYTIFEQMCVLTAVATIDAAGIDGGSPDLQLFISSTKGNVGLLADDMMHPGYPLGHSAMMVARFFSNPNIPVVASNACVSGVSAQIAAVRALLAGRCRHALVIGCDVLSRFIIAGFQSFKALASEPCRPFDAARCGLNLGEAAASMLLSSTDVDDRWCYIGCSNHNDANHISGPSRTAEGALRVIDDLHRALPDVAPACISLHGTATMYNDEMEAIAIHRAGLDNVPVMGLKGYYGHTLGAAGVLETVLTMAAIDRGIVLPTRGYADCGVSYPLNIASHVREVHGDCFYKIMSGFGGSNAGIAYRRTGGVV